MFCAKGEIISLKILVADCSTNEGLPILSLSNKAKLIKGVLLTGKKVEGVAGGSIVKISFPVQLPGLELKISQAGQLVIQGQGCGMILVRIVFSSIGSHGKTVRLKQHAMHGITQTTLTT